MVYNIYMSSSWVCDIIIERIDIKMRQKDETKQAEIMRALYSMRNTGHFPSLEVEEESLWQEVTQLLRTSVLFSESPLMKARILIFQDWEKFSLSYRMGETTKTWRGSSHWSTTPIVLAPLGTVPWGTAIVPSTARQILLMRLGFWKSSLSLPEE